MPQFRKAISPCSLDAAARLEKAVALAFPEFLDSADKSSDSSEEERHSNDVLNLSNDSTYYADDEYLTSIIDGSSASVVSSLVVLPPPNDGSDGESVYTTSSSGTMKCPMMDDDPLVSRSQTYCGISNGDEAVTVPHSSERPTPPDAYVLMLWEKILLAVVVLVVLFCCGITSIVIFEFRNPNPGTAAVPTTSTNVTIVPALPSSNRERFRLLCSYIGCDDNDPIIGTPQYEALFWMTNVDSPTILGDINNTDLANDDDLKRRIIQRYALLVFFFAVIGPEHLLLGGWASVTGARLPECLWPGVTCRATPGTKDPTVVVGLLFDATIARLHGSLPTDLGLLSNLGRFGKQQMFVLWYFANDSFPLTMFHCVSQKALYLRTPYLRALYRRSFFPCRICVRIHQQDYWHFVPFG